ncbi:glycosyltransferase [Diaphorobacter sp. HDW4B]|uniref:glycosyltransferase n=1 Tax=Diaphorobacter sp. HDW4B TaxID=2714925 RepID=UPI00140CF553|nr:glycosyltransferase [Diaphorobacter sp. HDW4B]QIL71838.1 glycosyltransferase [Diaphorobacter sp. HDW4B]
MPSSPSICLNMIVKDESAVIERCLRSVRSHVHSWVIVDTGSSDDTMEKIRSIMDGIPGMLHQRPWRNFGHNRSEAVQLAYASGADYVLFMDADDTLVPQPDFTWPAMDADQYQIGLRLGTLQYVRTMLVSTRLAWRWTGVLHEYPESTPPAATTKQLDGVHILSACEGARSSDPDKYKKDATMLREALVLEPHNTRYAFYLAQSLRDAGDSLAALKAYRHRVTMGGWIEEHWRAALEVARLEERLGNPLSTVQQSYLAAFELRVQRAEPLVDLARYMRRDNRFALAYLYAGQACKLPMPSDKLFVEAPVYQWMRFDELSIAAYYVGEYAESLRLCEQLLQNPDLPEFQRARIIENRQFAIDKLAA